MNLVTNALKFSPEDEPVAIEVLEANGGLRVAVTDRGAGIAPEDFPKLFQKFSRLTEPAGHKRTRGQGWASIVAGSWSRPRGAGSGP